MTRTSDWSRGTGRAGFAEQIQDMWQTRPLRLPQHGPIAGVAAGFGRRYNVDPVLIRVAFVVSALFGGAGIVLYLLGWLLLNQAGDQSSAAESLFGKGQSSQTSSKTIVLLVALGIAVSTMGPVGVGLGGSGVVSFGLMLAGWWLLHQRQPEPPIGYLEQPGEAALGGFPGANSPFWTGYPGTTAPFEGYGPYTKLPDSYVPDPNQQQAAEAPTEVLATQPVPEADPIANEAETVVLRKQNAAVGTEDTAAQQTPPTDAVSDTGTVVLHKNPAPKAPVSDSEQSDTPASNGAVVEKTPDAMPAEREESALHRIPAMSERPSFAYGPAPISPDFGPTPPGWDPFAVAPLAWDLPEPVPAQVTPVVQTPERKPRSRLTPVVIGLSLLAAAAAGSAAAAGVEWMTPSRIGAAALAVLALGLIIGAFLRRGYGLMVLLAPLAGFVILSSLIGPIQFDQGAMGDRTWSAAAGTELLPEYHVSMGSATLDLSKLALTEDHATTVSVRMGDARVILPPNLRVHTTCTVRLGDSNCVSGMSGPATGPVLNLTVDVQMGNAEVQRG
ncbi:PspC domain-containing protein [Nocardia sp. NBC_01503]|uniref:PspC domain-containing protein n=1 Tax=Nocardia sp. NBC_01503 TaxID=2975997 RepID=UPI002E7C2E96|nr:PspC domain-containing protein [Nocardia sp. NBC_01503]WTL33820.1 PspC domain-containing protein [Nocardia sp. NBC_01503]